MSVEVNLIEKRARMRSEKKVTYRDDTLASTSDTKYDSLAKTMERLGKMVENLTVQVSNQNRNQNHNQNQNFRRNNPPNRQRDTDQQVIPPFQEKFLDEDEGIIEESEGTTINMVEIDDSIHNCSTEENQTSHSYWDVERLESEEYRLGFENSIMQVRE